MLAPLQPLPLLSASEDVEVKPCLCPREVSLHTRLIPPVAVSDAGLPHVLLVLHTVKKFG